jgi:hypothetical protein
VRFRECVGLDDDGRSGLAVVARRRDDYHIAASSIAWIGGVELRNRFDEAQCFLLAAAVELGNLGRDAFPDGLQPRIFYHKTQFTQVPFGPPLAHDPHSFSRCSHFDLRARFATPGL